MSEQGIEFNPPSNEGNDNEGGQGVNPAWNDVLSIVPENLHSQLIPHFKNWDSGVQNKIQTVHSDWADYKFLKENQVSADDTRIALGVMRAIQEDPKSVYDSLATSYGYGQQQGEPEVPEALKGIPPEILSQLSQLQGGYETMAQILLQKQEAEQAQAADSALEKELSGLKSKHGNFDESYVLAQMYNGASGEQAVKQYQALVDQIMTEKARPAAPKLLGSGSVGIPGNKTVDVRKLGSAETKNLVMEILAANQSS